MAMSAYRRITTNSYGSQLVAIIFAIAATGAAFGAPEPWADPRLPVNTGLELWLDASRQNGARQIRLLPPLTDNHPVDLWFDGSGNRIDLGQRLLEARPHFKFLPSGAFIRFDGVNDSLAASNLRRSLTNATIFVVAAPRSNTGGFRAFLALNAA